MNGQPRINRGFEVGVCQTVPYPPAVRRRRVRKKKIVRPKRKLMGL